MLVARLRRKIEPNPKAPQFILSVPGVGYKFGLKPQPVKPQMDGNALATIDLVKPDPQLQRLPHDSPSQKGGS